MKKTFKVVMLPTKPIKQEDITREGHFHEGLLLQKEKLYLEGTLTYLYIISDDEIKEGDYIINLKYNWVKKVDKAYLLLSNNREDKKIVATTDKSMGIEDSIRISQGRFDNVYPTFKPLPQLPESFIQAFIKAYNEGKPITEVDLELEPNESKGCFTIKTRSDNTVIVHQSKMYSRDEVISLIEKFHSKYTYANNVVGRSKWIQDNL